MGAPGAETHPVFKHEVNDHRGMGDILDGTAKQLSAKLGKDKVITAGIAYPAVAVANEQWTQPGEFAVGYNASITRGASAIVEAIANIHAQCADTTMPKIVLAGYSQGADAVDLSLANLMDTAMTDSVTGVLFYESPTHQKDRPENVSEVNTDGVRDLGRAPGSRLWIDRHPGRTASFCRFGDLVCDASSAIHVGWGVQVHTNMALGSLPCPAAGGKLQFVSVCGTNSVLKQLGRADLINNKLDLRHTDTGDYQKDMVYNAPAGQRFRIQAVLGSIVKRGVEQFDLTVNQLAQPVTLPVWWHSEPVPVGTLTVANGVGTGEFAIPADATPGLHHFVVTFPDNTTGSIPVWVDPAAPHDPNPPVGTVSSAYADEVGKFDPYPPVTPTGSVATGSIVGDPGEALLVLLGLLGLGVGALGVAVANGALVLPQIPGLPWTIPRR